MNFYGVTSSSLFNMLGEQYYFSVDDSNSKITEFPGSEFRQTRSEWSDYSPISTVHFDKTQDILWTGNQNGCVTPYHSSILQKDTAFQLQPNKVIRDIKSMDNGILVLSENYLRFQDRDGLTLCNYTSEHMLDMQCLMNYSSTSLLMGGYQEKIIDFDLNVEKVKRMAHVGDEGCAIIRPHSKLVCVGDAFGRIVLKDPLSLNTQHVLNHQNRSISDFDVKDNYLITCGSSCNKRGHFFDRYLLLYDLRQMKLINMVPLFIYPMLVKFLPSYSSRVVAVSPSGQMEVLDTVITHTSESLNSLAQVNVGDGIILCLDVPATSSCICFGDSEGSIHLMSSKLVDKQFTSLKAVGSKETESDNQPAKEDKKSSSSSLMTSSNDWNITDIVKSYWEEVNNVDENDKETWPNMLGLT